MAGIWLGLAINQNQTSFGGIKEIQKEDTIVSYHTEIGKEVIYFGGSYGNGFKFNKDKRYSFVEVLFIFVARST